MGRKFLPIFLILLGILPYAVIAQDWKTHYDEAVNAYRGEQYPDALRSAELAYTKATDKKSKAYALQLVTAISLETEQYERSLQLIDEEITLFLDTEGSSSKNYSEALKKQVRLLEAKNDLSAALQKIQILIATNERIYGTNHVEFSKVLLYQATLLLQKGSYEDAQKILQRCSENLKIQPDAIGDYLTTLYLAGVVDTKLNAEALAHGKFEQYLRLAEKHSLQNTEEYQQVKSLYRGPLNNERQSSSKASNSQAVELSQRYLAQGLRQHEQMRLDSAIVNYIHCEKIIVEEGLKNKTAFSLYINYASALISEREIPNAQSKLDQARAIGTSLFATGDVEFGHLRKVEAELLLTQGRKQEAGEKYLQALNLFKPLQPANKVLIVKSIVTKLLNANSQSFARQVIEWLDLETLKSLPEQEQTDITILYTATFDSHEDQQAIHHLTAQLDKTGEPENKARLQINLAALYVQTGEINRAVKLLQDVMRLQKISMKQHADAAFQLARIQQHMGQFSEAERSYETAIKAYGTAGSKYHNELEEASNSLATFYLTLGNYDAAEYLYNNLIKQTDPSSVFYSTLNQNLAAVYEQTSRYEGAKILLEETLEHDKKLLGTSHPDYAITLQNLGALYLKMGELSKAKELFIQALGIDKVHTGTESLPYASKLANLGTVYQELGELAKAKDCYEKALNIRKALIGKKHPDYIYNQYLLAVLLQRQKLMDEAYPLFKSVSEFYLDEINEVFPALSEIEKTAFYNKVSEPINAYQDFAIDHGKNKLNLLGELYDFRLATKAILLNSLTKVRNRILHSGNADLISKFNEWQHIKSELTKLYAFELSEKSRVEESIEIFQTKANTLEKYLSSQSELFADHHDNKKISWHQVKAKLKPGEAAIEIVRLRLNQKNDSIIYAALILQHDAATPKMVIYPDGKQLETREFNMYKNCIQYQIPNTRSYEIYWKPLEPLLKNVNTVYFSPDGIFNKINLETLFDPGDGKFLIDRMDVRLVSNTREVLNQNVQLQKPTDATLLGHVDFGSGLNNGSVTSTQHLRTFAEEEHINGIPELPGTQHEVDKISALLMKNQWRVNLYTRAMASEEKIKEQHSPTVLHIATHGFFIESPDQDTRVVYSYHINETENNPLLRSGLLLAGSEKNLYKTNKTSPTNLGEDGILTALEAMNLNLDNTNLVVLSACETGSGQIKNGEGVFGLQRAFLVSGAQSVLMSLWKVDDEATQELMTEFYKQWLATNDKRSALRRTLLKIKEKFPEPYYWGGFIMIGH
jgi:CHAT domain-containing protein/Tfp pilus assembly protein PilF